MRSWIKGEREQGAAKKTACASEQVFEFSIFLTCTEHTAGSPSVKEQIFPLQRNFWDGRDGDQWVCFKFISWSQNFAVSLEPAFVYG